MSLLTSPHQPPPAPPASSLPSPSAVPNDPQSPKQHKEPLSNRLNDFMASKPKMHCLRSLRRGVSVCVMCLPSFMHVCAVVSPPVPEPSTWMHCMSEAAGSRTSVTVQFSPFSQTFFCKVKLFKTHKTIKVPGFQGYIRICSI